LSVTLDGMMTRTSVAFDPALVADEITLAGKPVRADDRERVLIVLDRVRRAAAISHHAHVESTNDFPTASGLASSASGYAALALAATRAAKLDWTEERVSDLARRGSASAARSIFGGFVELAAGSENGTEDEMLAARAVAPRDALDVRVLVCVVTEEQKAVSSREAMAWTAERSPYHAAWLTEAPQIFDAMKLALLAGDIARVGELVERSALAMHASAMAAGVIFVRGATLDLFARVRALREQGAAAYATSDAGPHVKVLVATRDAVPVRGALESVNGVLRIIEAQPGSGARVVGGDA
jgi:diphosphomevalonate decarboxylase